MLVAIIVNIVLGIFLVVFLQNCFELYNELALNDEDATSNSLLLIRLHEQKFSSIGYLEPISRSEG